MDVKKDEESDTKLQYLYLMMADMCEKLDKLDNIQEKFKTICEDELKRVKTSIEFAHGEIKDLKKES